MYLKNLIKHLTELTFKDYAILIILAFILIIILFWIRKYILKKIALQEKITRKHKNTRQYSLIVVAHFAKYLIFYVILLLFAILFSFFNIFEIENSLITQILFVIFMISLLFPFFKITDLFLDNAFNITHNKVASVSIIKTVFKIVIILILIITILATLKISITPLLATLGLGGVTLAFGFKDFLASFFAGFSLLFSHEIKLDDFIELETGEKGKIVDINWQFTKLQILGDNMIYIPNMKLINMIIKNFNLPTKELSVRIEIEAHYSNDFDLVERISLDTAKEIAMTIPGAQPNFEPFVRFNQFSATGIVFGVFLRAIDFPSQFLISHEFIKLALKKFKENNIATPYYIVDVQNKNRKGF